MKGNNSYKNPFEHNKNITRTSRNKTLYKSVYSFSTAFSLGVLLVPFFTYDNNVMIIWLKKWQWLVDR